MKPVVLMSVTLVTFPEVWTAWLVQATGFMSAQRTLYMPGVPVATFTWTTRQWLFPIRTARNGDPGVAVKTP